MDIWHVKDPENLSTIAMRDALENENGYSHRLSCHNDDVVYCLHASPGIIEVVSRHGTDDVLVLTGGIHGDERAGIVILDRLLHNIRKGLIPVRRNLLLMYGNLLAMAANDGRGLRCIEPEVGVTANLNRCFGRGTFSVPRCYAELRANQMMAAARRFKGCEIEAIDIHQSFAVPTLHEVRVGGDRTEYTYAMLYPNDLKTTMDWIYRYFSDIVAGAVVNDMTKTHYTWAGYMASEYSADAATFEQGTIGHIDHVTFTPQLYENLTRSISINGPLPEPQGFDVWKCVGSITRETEAFTFLDSFGAPVKKAPLDFTPIHCRNVARDGERVYTLAPEERLLFGNGDVPIGDRAAQIIVRFDTDLVPGP